MFSIYRKPYFRLCRGTLPAVCHSPRKNLVKSSLSACRVPAETIPNRELVCRMIQGWA